MRFPNVLSTTVVAAFALAPLLSGQTSQVSPAPTQTEDEAAEVAPAAEPPGVTRVGFVRVWYFGAPGAPHITLAIRSAEGTQTVLGSDIRPDRMLSYRPIRPGNYALAIFDGDILPDENGQLPQGSTPKSSGTLKVDRGAFATVVVRYVDGKWIPSSFSDNRMDDDTGPVFRIFDFLNAAGGKVSVTVGDKTKQIWATGAGLATETSLPGFSGAARFQFGKSVGNTFTVTNSTETNLSSRMSYSLVLYPDRYGHDAFAVVENARAAVLPGDVEALGN